MIVYLICHKLLNKSLLTFILTQFCISEYDMKN